MGRTSEEDENEPASEVAPILRPLPAAAAGAGVPYCRRQEVRGRPGRLPRCARCLLRILFVLPATPRAGDGPGLRAWAQLGCLGGRRPPGPRGGAPPRPPARPPG